MEKITINKKDIVEIYKEHCNEIGIRFRKKEFEDFLKFLEVDLYDWIKENLRCYFREKSQKLVKGQEVEYNGKR